MQLRPWFGSSQRGFVWQLCGLVYVPYSVASSTSSWEGRPNAPWTQALAYVGEELREKARGLTGTGKSLQDGRRFSVISGLGQGPNHMRTSKRSIHVS